MSNEGQNRRSPNARLQDRIILYLGQHNNVETVTGLSRALGSPRSSTSRAINRLKSEGLVRKVEGRWILTDEGMAEAARLRPRVQERSKRAYKELERIERLQREWERTMGSPAIQKAMKAQPSIKQVMEGQTALQTVVKGESAIQKELEGRAAIQRAMEAQPTIQRLAEAQAAIQGMEEIQTAAEGVVRVQSIAQETLRNWQPSPLQMEFQMRPFFEALRLVDSVGVGNQSIAYSLQAVSDAVRANWPNYMQSVSKTVQAGGLTSDTLKGLSSTLDLINTKLGESVFASVQVRAVEDLLKRFRSPVINPDALEAFTSQVDFASGTVVREILKQADPADLLDGDVVSTEVASDTLTDELPASLDDAPSALRWQNWNELPEVVKLRIVAAATFIILHVALLVAQEQPDDHKYVTDLLHALGGTALVVTICKQLELFQDE